MAAKKHTPAPITDNTSARLSKPLPSAETQRLAMLKPTEAAELADLQDAAMAVASEATAAMAMAAAQQNTAALVTEGSAVYYVPKQMTELQTTTVTLWIDADSSLQQLVNEFASTLNLEAATVSAHKLKIAAGSDAAEDKRIGNIARTRLLVTDIMHAELSGGSEFTIRPHGKIKQSLSNTGRAKWPWQVTPNLAADSAELRINVWIDPTGTGTLTESYSNVIRVYPKPQSWSDKLYQLLSDINAWLALLGIGGIGVILPFIYRRFAGKHQGADG
jgi:predicted P-loop ATPase/GTPase